MRKLIAFIALLGLPLLSVADVTFKYKTGDSAALSVTVDGDAPFTYQWRKGGVPIVGATNATYSFAALSAADAGTYTVTVSNAAGSTVSDNGFLVSLVAPTSAVITITRVAATTVTTKP